MFTLLYDQNDGLILFREKMLTLIEINFWLENLLFASRQEGIRKRSNIMKLAVLLSAGHPFPEAALNQAAQLAKTLDLPLTGIISSEQGLTITPWAKAG